MKNQITMIEAFPEIFSGSEFEKSEIEEMETRERIKAFIASYFEKHLYMPSFQEIGDGVGLRSKSSVHAHIKKLFSDGFLETDYDERVLDARAYRIAGYKVAREMDNGKR